MSKEIPKTRQTKAGIAVKINGSYELATNFNAEIIDEIEIEDDANTIDRQITLRTRLKGVEKNITTSIKDFIEGTWIQKHLGIDAELYGVTTERNLHQLIKKASKRKTKKTKVRRLGFYKHNGEMVFLHNGGALLADGSNSPLLSAYVDGTIQYCVFPPLGDDDDMTGMVDHFLKLPEVTPNNPYAGSLLLAAITRAPLTSHKLNNVVPWFIGQSGFRKTAFAMVGQKAFGVGFTEPPLNFTSTPKSTELAVQQANNILSVTDDYTPDLNKSDVKLLMELLLGGVGNGAIRGKKISATENAPMSLIRSVPLLTAEEIPEITQSRKERSIFCKFMESDVDNKNLTKHQHLASQGNFAKVIGQYIIFILKHYDRISDEINAKFELYRDQGTATLSEGLHSRAPSNYADMMLGIHYFLKFCSIEGHITSKQESEIRRYHSKNLIQLINMQPIIHQTQDFKHMVLVEMSAHIRSGQFFLADITHGKKQLPPEKYPKSFVGWVDHDEDKLFIKSDCANKLTANLPEKVRKVMSGGKKSFWSDAYRFGLLAEKDQKKNVIRKTINGNSERVYSMVYALMYSNHDSLRKSKSSKVA